MQDAILGLDIGTTSIKAVLFDLSGREVVTAEQSYPLHTPQAGWVEQDPAELWGTVVDVIRTVTGQAGAEQHILALSLATQCGSVVPIGADGSPLYPIITWMDRRTKDLIQQWRAEGVEAIVRQIGGWLLQPGLSLPSIVWLRRFRPDIFAAAERYLSVNDFLTYRLTGNFCTNLSCATEMQLVDVASGQWSQTLCTLAGISPDQLSTLQPSGAIIGSITSEVSRLTGLSGQTLVINGGHDHCCEALAMGMTSAGKLLLTCGTAWVLTEIVETSSVDAIPANMDLNFHVVPQRWTISQFLGGLGAGVEWWLNQAWQHVDPETSLSRAEMYDHFDQVLAQSRPGCNGLLFLPLDGGSQLPTGNHGGGFIGLRLDHTRADMARAILEGAAFELRWALENIRQAGLPVEQLWMAGGATRSPIWPRLMADISGIPIFLTQYAHWSALGAAILAGLGAGVFETVEAGQASFKKPTRHLTPDEAHKPIYDERFAAYRRMSRLLSQV